MSDAPRRNRLGFGSRAIHAGQEPDPLTGAIVPPTHTASTFVLDGVGQDKGFRYGRVGNPTRAVLEACVADLEGAERAYAFASGLAAAATLLELLPAGSTIVAHDDLYGGIYRLLQDVRTISAGHTLRFVDFSDVDALDRAARGADLLWFETPSNPLLKIVDIEAVVAIAAKEGAITVCDNTFASPWAQRPLELGCQFVIHSATKFLNGHSDLIGGIAAAGPAASAERIERLGYLQYALGAVPSPTDCSLLLRSLKTLHLRMERHVANAQALAEALRAEKAALGLRTIRYPGFPEHEGHAIAKRQMRGFGSMITLVLEGDLARVERVLTGTELFQFAVSLGGVESLIQHPSSLTHKAVPEERRKALGIEDNLIRLSVGVEDVDDLIADLRGALAL